MNSPHEPSAAIDQCGVLRLSGKFPDHGLSRAAIDALVMPLVSIGKRYVCVINDGPKFHATPRMMGDQFAFCAEGDFWVAKSSATGANV